MRHQDASEWKTALSLLSTAQHRRLSDARSQSTLLSALGKVARRGLSRVLMSHDPCSIFHLARWFRSIHVQHARLDMPDIGTRTFPIAGKHSFACRFAVASLCLEHQHWQRGIKTRSALLHPCGCLRDPRCVPLWHWWHSWRPWCLVVNGVGPKSGKLGTM